MLSYVSALNAWQSFNIISFNAIPISSNLSPTTLFLRIVISMFPFSCLLPPNIYSFQPIYTTKLKEFFPLKCSNQNYAASY